MSVQNNIDAIKRARAIVNHTSSTNDAAYERLERLRVAASDHFEITEVMTQRSRDTTIEHIRSALETSDLVIIVAGDGTFNSVVRTLVNNHLSPKAKQTPIWSLGGGNAEDGTKAAHSADYLLHPERIIEDGHIKTVSTLPLCFDIKKPGMETVTLPAAFYATLGLTALMANDEYLDRQRTSRHGQSKHPELGRLMHSMGELAFGVRGMIGADYSSVTTDEGPTSFIDMGFIRSHIMAKYLRFPVHLNEQRMFHYVVPDKLSLLEFVPTALIGGALKEPLPGGYMGQGDHMSFTTNHDIYAQFDGESELIPADSQVTVRMHDQPLNLVVTNPNL